MPLPLGPGGAEIVAHFSAIGNAHLLQRLDFHQVQCSRRFFAYRRDRYGNPLPDEPPALETREFDIANQLASTMISDGAADINYHGMTPANIDRLALEAVATLAPLL